MQDEGALVVPPAFIIRLTNDLRFAITGIPDLLYGKRLLERRPCRSNLPCFRQTEWISSSVILPRTTRQFSEKPREYFSPRKLLICSVVAIIPKD
jgi:hypothetical protein